MCEDGPLGGTDYREPLARLDLPNAFLNIPRVSRLDENNVFPFEPENIPESQEVGTYPSPLNTLPLLYNVAVVSELSKVGQ